MSENENLNHNPEVNESEEDKSPLETFIYHQRKALEEAGKALDALLPDGFKSHGSEAGREFVKSFKVLVDAAITEIEKATSRVTVEGEDDDRPSTTGKTKVKVQVD